MLKPTNLPIVNGIGELLPQLEKGVRYTFVDRGYYLVALRAGETEEVKPELPKQEWEYRLRNPIKEWQLGGHHEVL